MCNQAEENLHVLKNCNETLYKIVRLRYVSNQDNLKEILSSISLNSIDRLVGECSSYSLFLSTVERSYQLLKIKKGIQNFEQSLTTFFSTKEEMHHSFQKLKNSIKSIG
jgi:hypothetical protein